MSLSPLLLQSASPLTAERLVYGLAAALGVPLLLAAVAALLRARGAERRAAAELRDDVRDIKTALLGYNAQGGALRKLDALEESVEARHHKLTQWQQSIEVRLTRCEDEDRRVGERRTPEERRAHDRRGGAS